MQTGRVETNDCIFETQLPAEHFRQSGSRVDAEVISGARASQVAIDNERANAVSLRQQPGEIESRQRLAFGDARTRDDDSPHLFALGDLEYLRSQRTKLLGVSRARLADRDEMGFDARRRNVVGDESSGARRTSSVQSCPSITRSYSAGECRPAGNIRSVRSGR